MTDQPYKRHLEQPYVVKILPNDVLLNVVINVCACVKGHRGSHGFSLFVLVCASTSIQAQILRHAT